MEEGAKQLKCQQLHLPITGHLDMQVALRWTAAQQSLTWDRTQRKQGKLETVALNPSCPCFDSYL